MGELYLFTALEHHSLSNAVTLQFFPSPFFNQSSRPKICSASSTLQLYRVFVNNSHLWNFCPEHYSMSFFLVSLSKLLVCFVAMVQAGLQIGAHGGVRLTQCRSARLETSKTIPVQVDGEPCRLPPSVIYIKHRNQAAMIQRPKHSTSLPESPE